LNIAAKTFRVKQEEQETTCCAVLLVEHKPAVALKYLHHFGNAPVREWIYRSLAVRKAVVGWSSLEAYGKRMNWPVKQVSSLTPISTPENHGKSGGGAGSDERYTHTPIAVRFFGTPSSVVEDEEMVPLPTAFKPVVVSELGMNSGGEAVINKEDNRRGGEESNALPEDNTGYTSPCDEEANRGEEEATDKDNKSIKSMKSVELENICAGGHCWEEGNKPSYAVSIGIFTGRKCFGCRA
jgi:hypothetical protein